MADNEIIKALECCSNRICYTCPLYSEDGCEVLMSRDALALICRQKAEIERLTGDVFTYKLRWAKATAKLDTAKAEAIKEFAGKLKVSFSKCKYKANTHRKTVRVEELVDQAEWILHTVTSETIDSVAKEMGV